MANSSKSMYWVANSALGVSVAGCIVTYQFPALHPSVPYFRAFLEAATVGAIADWFAVTALFRRPLGMPIPHTAIIPRNKDRLGAALGQFVESNFLAEDTVSEKLKMTSISRTFTTWITMEGRTGEFADKIISVIPLLAKAANSPDFRKYFILAFMNLAQTINISRVIGSFLKFISDDKNAGPFLDELLGAFQRLLGNHYIFIRRTLEKELPWYIPKFIHNRIYKVAVKRIQKKLEEASLDPQHSLRQHILSYIGELSTELPNSERLDSFILSLKNWGKNSPGFSSYIESVWQSIVQGMQSPDTSASATLANAINSSLFALFSELKKDEDALNALDAVLHQALLDLISRHRSGFSKFIADTISSWDEKTISDKIELAVGNDLQYIRLNGTLVGGIAGLLIFLIAENWHHFP